MSDVLPEKESCIECWREYEIGTMIRVDAPDLQDPEFFCDWECFWRYYRDELGDTYER